MLFFRKKPKLDSYSIVSEKWNTNFGFFNKNRFAVEQAETYESGINRGKFFLALKKKNHFAWVLSELYRYRDFCLEAEISFKETNPYSAFGFILRHINDENFYYFLISNKGFFRFDLVFNGNPLVRIDWTESSLIKKNKNNLRIIAHDAHFSFYLDDEWIAEIEEDTINAGRIGFAAQNFNEDETADFYIDRFVIESRPVDVEKHFIRWVYYIPQNPLNRIQLAKTFFSMGEFPAAAVQMKKALRYKKPEEDDYFFFAEILVNLKMYDMALKNIEECIKLNPDQKDALHEKVNILYLQNRFIEARDFLKENIDLFKDNPNLWNLLGNLEYSLGNWDSSFEAYNTACRIQKDMPIFIFNTARALEMAKKKDQALEYYIRASRLFFRQEAYNELYPIFSQVQKLDIKNREVIALEGKILFHEQKNDEAEKIFLKLISERYEDASIYFLAGIISCQKGNRKKALEFFQQACELEDDYYLYWLKFAENLFLSGQNPEEELKKALSLAPDNPWVLNQFGLYYFKKGDASGAKEYLNKAKELAPAEPDIIINLSDILSKTGEIKEAFRILDQETFKDNDKITNHRGNLFARLRNYKDAIKEYEKALNLDSNNPVYLENCAKACIEMDMIMRAEELLTRLLDISTKPSTYNLIGYLALIKREWIRAEVSFQKGLEVDPQNLDIKLNLASLYLDRSDYQKAKKYALEVLDIDSEYRGASQILMRIREKFEKSIICTDCGRQWWVPENIPPQAELKVHGEPPAEAPGGKCNKCQGVYCIECAQKNMKDRRFVCPFCDEYLKLSDNWLKYLIRTYIEKQQKQLS